MGCRICGAVPERGKKFPDNFCDDCRKMAWKAETIKRSDAMRATAKKIGILLVGWAFILFGVVGLILPILHGTLFLLIGLAILSPEYVWAHRLLSKIRNRFPSVTVRLEQATTAAHVWISKAFHRRGPQSSSTVEPPMMPRF